MYTSIMPTTVSAHDVQRNYRSVFTQAKKSPVVVLTNNRPDVAIVSIEYLDDLKKKVQEAEMKDTLKAIAAYKREEKAGTLQTAKSFRDLI